MSKLPSIICDILSLGVRVPAAVTGRRSGAGPAEGRALIIEGQAVNASISSPYASSSPYVLQEKPDVYTLYRHGDSIVPVTLAPEPEWYARQTASGIDYRHIALLHGADCLASTVFQECHHWRTNESCHFCGTELSLKKGLTLKRKTPEQLAEVACVARDLNQVTHVVLTSGTGNPPGAEIVYLAQCAAAVKSASGLPIHVQFAPPTDLSLVDAVYHAGVDTVGIHLESFDTGVLACVAPAKARIGLKHYVRSWERAVALFGPNQVSSFLIAGLGETPTSLIEGSELLADLGVYPFIVPLRPIAGTPFANARPPAPSVMQPVYEAVAAILHRKGLASVDCKAGCVRCGACSALAAFERPVAAVVYHRARIPQDIEDALAVRHEVFVEEQKIFPQTDRDAHDATSIHIVAKAGDTIAGTVRIYSKNNNGHWIGGRLAVGKAYRTGKVGARLVQEAVRQVQRQGATQFTARIQVQNVRFFQRLGWKPLGSPEDYMGRPHQQMQADLTC